MSVFSFLAKQYGKKIGKQLGKTIEKDLHATKAKEIWTHKEKILELEKENVYWVSPDYLKGLIQRSNTISDLNAIKRYLFNGHKVDNMTPNTVYSLIRGVKAKLAEVEEKEILKELIKQAKQNGTLNFIEWWL
jgi:hypothetical protein